MLCKCFPKITKYDIIEYNYTYIVFIYIFCSIPINKRRDCKSMNDQAKENRKRRGKQRKKETYRPKRLKRGKLNFRKLALILTGVLAVFMITAFAVPSHLATKKQGINHSEIMLKEKGILKFQETIVSKRESIVQEKTNQEEISPEIEETAQEAYWEGAQGIPYSAELVYHATPEVEMAMCQAVQAEAGGEPHEGKVAVAEEARESIASGYYEGNPIDILYARYNTAGYTGVISDDTKNAVREALNGSYLTERLLRQETERINEIRSAENEIRGLEGKTLLPILGTETWEGGARYHYNPDLTGENQLSKRTPEYVPVSVTIGQHIFYRYWIPS